MFEIACNTCGAAVTSLLPNSTLFAGLVVCGKCLKEEAETRAKKINETIRARNALIWHLGIFEDIGLDSNINPMNRFRVASLTRRLNDIIPDEDLSESFIDIGCNCGQYLRHLWLRGARKLIGAEPRQEHLDFAKTWAEFEGAEVEWQNKAVEDIPPSDLDDKIVLVLGLIYHLPKPDEFFAQIKASKMKYCLLESQVFEDETYVNEGVQNPQHGISKDNIWHPTFESIEAMLDKHGFKWERLEYVPGMGLTRGLWKVWGGTNESDNTVAA